MNSFFNKIKEIGGLKVGLLLITYFMVLWHLSDIFALLNKIGVILTPFAYGFVLAYLINSLMGTIRRFIYRVFKKELPYVLTMIVAYLLALAVVVFLMITIIPQVLLSLDGIIRDTPKFIESSYEWLEVKGVAYVQEITQSQVDLNNFLNNALNNMNKLSENMASWASTLANIAIDTTKFILNCILGIIISIYMLTHKDMYKGQAKKGVYAFLSEEKAKRVLGFLKSVNSTFSGFISAKSLDSLIIGVLCYIGCLILGFDNSLLIAIIVGITNFIPYFGPFIGAIPSALIVLMQSFNSMLIFCVFILILQQFDGNILGPKLLGYSMGLTSLWIIFAIIVTTSLFGIVGMVIGVPLFTIVYMWVKDMINDKLSRKGLSTETKDYVDLDAWKENCK